MNLQSCSRRCKCRKPAGAPQNKSKALNSSILLPTTLQIMPLVISMCRGIVETLTKQSVLSVCREHAFHPLPCRSRRHPARVDARGGGHAGRACGRRLDAQKLRSQGCSARTRGPRRAGGEAERVAGRQRRKAQMFAVVSIWEPEMLSSIDQVLSSQA